MFDGDESPVAFVADVDRDAPVVPGRSTRPRIQLCTRQRKRLSDRGAAWFRSEESRSAFQHRVLPAQLASFFLDLCQASRLIGRGTRTDATVDLTLSDPFP